MRPSLGQSQNPNQNKQDLGKIRYHTWHTHFNITGRGELMSVTIFSSLHTCECCQLEQGAWHKTLAFHQGPGCLFLLLSSAITHSWFCSVPHTQRVSAASGRDDLCAGWPQLFLNTRQTARVDLNMLSPWARLCTWSSAQERPSQPLQIERASTYLEVSIDSQKCQGFSSLMLSLLPPFRLLRLLGFYRSSLNSSFGSIEP